MPLPPGLLARGPWSVEQVEGRWREAPYAPAPPAIAAADAAIDALRERGSPAHDGLSARLVSFEATPERLALELEPIRWSLRLDRADAAQSMAATCVVRAADGRWLAGRRADWLATWPGRWALGAAGAIEPAENPAHTLGRELREEWSVSPERLTVEALFCLPNRLVMLIGLAWLGEGAQVTPDAEHDEFAWWPAAIEQWPAEADEPLRALATMLWAT
jgi:ADP-ribose pyrophosphatase YjhB (NUDIX family)